MSDKYYMSLALQLAESVAGQTSPNPPVGAVIVKNGEIVGMGAHLKAGTPHAEVHALNMAGSAANGGTAYVTLEPCSHHGKTPPCADALIKHGIKRVVVAIVDPYYKVSGQGIEKLEKAGIEVTVGVEQDRARALYRPFFNYVIHSRPFVTLKIAQSIDGKIATHTGESQWITSDASRADGHNLRRTHDAILVGVNTIIADNPSLTNRSIRGGKQPLRVIIDRSLRTPESANVIQDGRASTLIMTDVKNENDEKIGRFKKKGVTIGYLDHPDIEPTLEYLGQRKIMSVLVEGGATIHDAFIRSGCFNQVVFYIAPKIIGGHGALTSVAGEGFSHLSDTPDLERQSMTVIDEDIKLVYKKRDDGLCLRD